MSSFTVEQQFIVLKKDVVVVLDAESLNRKDLNASFLATGGWRVRSNSYIGASVSDSQVILNNSRFRLSNSLDVVSEKYYNNGYTNFSMSVQSNLLP